MNNKYFEDEYASSISHYTTDIYEKKGLVYNKFRSYYENEDESDLWMVTWLLKSWDGLMTHLSRALDCPDVVRLFRYSFVKYGPSLIDICKQGFLSIVTDAIDWNNSYALVKNIAMVYEKDKILCATALNYLSRVYFGAPKGENMHIKCMQDWLDVNQMELREQFTLEPTGNTIAGIQMEYYNEDDSVSRHIVSREYQRTPFDRPYVSYRGKEGSYKFVSITPYPDYLRQMLAEYAKEIVIPRHCTRLKERIYSELQEGAIELPAGSTADTGRKKGDAVGKLTKAYGNRFTGSTADGTGWAFGDNFDEVKRALDQEPTVYCRMVDVPKSGDKRRLIAPLSIVRAVFNRLIQQCYYQQEFHTAAKIFRFRYVICDLFDQTSNRLLAQEGSALGTYATIDLSSASDLMRESDFYGIMPTCVTDIFCYTNPLKVIIPSSKVVRTDGTVVTTTVASIGISGDALTFPKESAFLCLVIDFAAMYYRLFVTDEEWEELTRPYWKTVNGRKRLVLGSAYGDDGVVAKFLYETVCDIARTLGWKVNLAKSYNSGSFREACGGWYHNGMDTTPIFFPRKPIIGTPDDGPIRGDFTTVDEKQTQEDSLATLIKATNRVSRWPEAQQPLLDLLLRSKYARKLTCGEDPRDGIHIMHMNPDLKKYRQTPYRVERVEERSEKVFRIHEAVGLPYGESIGEIRYKVSCTYDPYSVDPSKYDADDAAYITKIRKSWSENRSDFHEEEHRGLQDLHADWKHTAGENDHYDTLLYRTYLAHGPQYVSEPILKEFGVVITQQRTIFDPIKDKIDTTSPNSDKCSASSATPQGKHAETTGSPASKPNKQDSGNSGSASSQPSKGKGNSGKSSRKGEAQAHEHGVDEKGKPNQTSDAGQQSSKSAAAGGKSPTPKAPGNPSKGKGNSKPN